MKVSLSWLKEYVSFDLSPTELADALTMAGLEVEAVDDRYAHLSSVVVGRIEDVRPHPDADRLRVCTVDAGEKRVTVVCGAPNAEQGMVAPLALPGTVLPDGLELFRSRIRGIDSEGMLCSAGEIGLGADRSGLMSLPPDLPIGAPIADALNLSDIVFEIGLTPNRSDCLSILGVAREVAAIAGTALGYPDIQLPEGKGRIEEETSVTIQDPDHCPRYAARMISGIKIGPSPEWLRNRLLSIGLKPISNIVDVTNFVMMEMGQPLHAFDFDHLEEGRIVVRTAREGEKFITLDDKERTLAGDMLMICDGVKPVAVGGVMGGLNSEIEDGTTRVLIESAYFDPVSIRKTAKRLVLATDASHRFERGVDPEGTLKALDRAAQLMLEVAGGELVSGRIDARPKVINTSPISLSISGTNRHLGTNLDGEAIKQYLKSLEFAVASKSPNDQIEDTEGDTLTVTPPSFRVDVSRPEDLMEEVARRWGYNNIPTTVPVLPVEAKPPAGPLGLRNEIRAILTGLGFMEAINYSFIHAEFPDHLGLDPEDDRRRTVPIVNPLTEDQAVMRTSLVPGLLSVVSRNLSWQIRTIKLFEVGKVFLPKAEDPADALPDEPEMLACIWTGMREGHTSWYAKDAPIDFYDIKGAAEGLLHGLRVEGARFSGMEKAKCTYLRYGHAAEIRAGDVTTEEATIGWVGEIRPEVLEKYEIKQPLFIFEFYPERMRRAIRPILQSDPIPKYPSVSRDITLIVDKNLESERILEAIRDTGVSGVELVEESYVFGAYEGGNIPDGKRSLSFRIVYRSPDRTLEDEEINQVHKAIADGLLKRFKADLPA